MAQSTPCPWVGGTRRRAARHAFLARCGDPIRRAGRDRFPPSPASLRWAGLPESPTAFPDPKQIARDLTLPDARRIAKSSAAVCLRLLCRGNSTTGIPQWKDHHGNQCQSCPHRCRRHLKCGRTATTSGVNLNTVGVVLNGCRERLDSCSRSFSGRAGAASAPARAQAPLCVTKPRFSGSRETRSRPLTIFLSGLANRLSTALRRCLAASLGRIRRAPRNRSRCTGPGASRFRAWRRFLTAR